MFGEKAVNLLWTNGFVGWMEKVGDEVLFDRIEQLKVDFGQENAVQMLEVTGFPGWIAELEKKLFSHCEYKRTHLLMNKDLCKKIKDLKNGTHLDHSSMEGQPLLPPPPYPMLLPQYPMPSPQYPMLPLYPMPPP